MVIYVEVALLENFLLDGVLLYLAIICARAKFSLWRLTVAAGVGAGEAVLFPLLTLPVWAAYLLKFFGGVLLVLIVISGKKVKPYLIGTAVFFFLTFALGGFLTAAYSFFNIEYEEGNGFLVERAPVGLILGGAAIFAIAVIHSSKSFYRYRKMKRNLLSCRLRACGKEVSWEGYADSGNCLFYHGNPVCVTSAAAIFALFGRDVKEVGRMEVGTVNGSREAPVFECESIQIIAEKQIFTREKVYLTVGEVSSEYKLVLNTALMEG